MRADVTGEVRSGARAVHREFVAGRQGIGETEAEAWGAEQRELMERDEFYFASTQFCFTATKRTRETTGR